MNAELIAKVLIPLIGGLILYMLIPFIKSKTTQKQRDDLYFYIQLMVLAAEEIFKHSNPGITKKEYVMQQLEKAGIDITDPNIDMMRKAAVEEMRAIKDTIIAP